MVESNDTRIDYALEEIASAAMYLMSQGQPLGIAHDSYIRAIDGLVEIIIRDRKAARTPADFGYAQL